MKIFLIGVAILTLFAFSLFYMHRRADRKRAQAVRAALRDSSIELIDALPHDLRKHARAFCPFRRSTRPAFKSPMRATTQGLTVYGADVVYWTSGGEHGSRVRSFLVAISVTDATPDFCLIPQDANRPVFSRAFGHRDINFHDDPSFSDRYHLSSEEDRGVREHFNRERRRHLRRLQPPPVIARVGDWMLYCATREATPSADEIETHIARAVQRCEPLLAGAPA